MDEKAEYLIKRMTDPEEKEAFSFADKLGEVMTEESAQAMIDLISGDDWEKGYLASRAMSKSNYSNAGLKATIEAIFDKRNKDTQGAFTQILERYNLEDKFVDILRIYLFGNFKASQLAETYLNEVEFDVTPRTIRKAEKHWNHYLHNPEDEGSVEIKKLFVEPMLQEIRDLF